MRVMGNADEVGTHFFHQFHVTAVHLVRQGHTDGLLVLVATNAAQFVGLSVEEEALIAVEAEPSETGMVIGLVYYGFGLAVA